MVWDSHHENRVYTPSILGVPRWHKRISYYLFKTRYLQFAVKQLASLPNRNVRMKLAAPYSNEYEVYDVIK